MDFGGQPESCQVADQGGNCAGVGGWGYELSFFNGISVGMSGYCGLSFSVGRECCLYGSFGRCRGLLS